MQIVSAASTARLAAHSIFFGGGTPSLMPVEALRGILETAGVAFDVLESSENTLEANPGTASREYFAGIFRAGINRLSMGMQSSNTDDLRLLERIHTHEDLVRAVADARSAGFGNISLDLIYGIPLQTIDRWQATLREAVRLQPAHLSLYALTLERGTSLSRKVASRSLPEPDDDLAADMYEWASGFLAENGYAQYEISNWALAASPIGANQCRHNLQYWRNLPYLGFGAAAHGCAVSQRMANVSNLDEYIRLISTSTGRLPFPSSPANIETIPVDRMAEMQETMMLGLRLVREGVDCNAFKQRFDTTPELVFGEKIEMLVNAGLLERDALEADTIRLSAGGRLLGNRVFREFVGDD
jgi:oxygen-independent coproporphyrinogen-3 oxidase